MYTHVHIVYTSALHKNTHKHAAQIQSKITAITLIGTCTSDHVHVHMTHLTSGQEVQPAVKQRNVIRKYKKYKAKKKSDRRVHKKEGNLKCLKYAGGWEAEGLIVKI